MQMNIFILLVLALFTSVAKSADSDGKEFVFTFMTYQDTFGVISANAIVIPTSKDSICTFKYTRFSDNQTVSIQKTAIYGKTNEIILDTKEVLFVPNYVEKEIKDFAATDFRIFVSCTEEVKLIARLNDPFYGLGDLYLIHSTANAGKKYTFSIPTIQRDGIKGFAAIMPLTFEKSITVTTIVYVNGIIYSNETIQYDTKFGEEQHYISLYPQINMSSYNTSISISATSNFLVSFMSPDATTGDGDCRGRFGLDCDDDITTAMMMPLVEKDCNARLSRPDQRMISNDFTTRVYISPPAVSDDCDELFAMTYFDQANNVDGFQEIITPIGSSTIELDGRLDIFSSTSSGVMPVYRFGSIHEGGDITYALGHFIHYIPSIDEWVTGKTQFFTLAKGCSIELYADVIGSDLNLVKLDGKALSTFAYTSTYLNYFNKRYGHFIVPVGGYGLHTIENGGRYVMYVICTAVNSPYDGQGYLTGFSKRRS
uniref:IgGFc_binding domain-containing protein n=1 Tax=Rhabditophanes sp. KR3021 TaxID=114890 RepID=A0AC35U4K3_9BILA